MDEKKMLLTCLTLTKTYC